MLFLRIQGVICELPATAEYVTIEIFLSLNTRTFTPTSQSFFFYGGYHEPFVCDS